MRRKVVVGGCRPTRVVPPSARGRLRAARGGLGNPLAPTRVATGPCPGWGGSWVSGLRSGRDHAMSLWISGCPEWEAARPWGWGGC